jgi:hypothetical protein
MRSLIAVSFLALSTAAVAQTPPSIVNQPSKLDKNWQAKTRALYEPWSRSPRYPDAMRCPGWPNIWPES